MGLNKIFPWYGALEAFLEPSYPLMVTIAVAIVIITIALVLHGDNVSLAAWLVYLALP